MPQYSVTVGHYLILETTVTVEALDRAQARGMVEHMRDRDYFGAIAWEIHESPMTEGKWHVVSHYVEIETVQEE